MDDIRQRLARLRAGPQGGTAAPERQSTGRAELKQRLARMRGAGSLDSGTEARAAPSTPLYRLARDMALGGTSVPMEQARALAAPRRAPVGDGREALRAEVRELRGGRPVDPLEDLRREHDSLAAKLSSLQTQLEQAERDRNASRNIMSGARYMTAQQQQRYGADKEAAQARYSALKGQVDALQASAASVERAAKAQEYRAYRQADDFKELSRYASTANGREARLNPVAGKYTETGFDDILYDAINGDKTARSHLLNTDTSRSYDLDSLDRDTVATFNYLYAAQGAQAAYDYLDFAAGERLSAIDAGTLGALQGTGLASLSAAIGKGLSAVTGDEEMEKRDREWYGDFMQDAALAQAQHPAAYGVGAVGGNLALLYGMGTALGAGEGALAEGVNIGGRTVAVKMAPAVQNMVNSSLTFLAADAVKNAGAAATGHIDPADYWESVGISGAQGLAGGLAGGLVSSGMATALRESGMMTPFMEFVRQTTSGFAAAGANIGTGYALREEKPSSEQIATDLATAFLFSVLQGGISAYNTTQANKAQMEQAVDQIAKRYSQMSKGWEAMAPEARAETAAAILEQTRGLRTSLNGTYMAGQQGTVDQMNAALDALETGLQGYVNGFQAHQPGTVAPGNMLSGGGLTSSAGPAAGGELAAVRSQLEAALARGPAEARGPGHLAAAGYRAVKPENVELPTVPIINLSMADVAALNGGVLPDSGGYLRKTAISRARARLGLNENSAAYIPASNVLRNGEEYVLKITKASLNKMFSPADGSAVPPEVVAVVENLERIANNGVCFDSQGDRKRRETIQGVDHLMTTVYIDNVPYVVDMRVRIVQRRAGDTAADNVLYYLTPETITTIKKADGGTSAAGRHASDGEAPPSTITTIPPSGPAVKPSFTGPIRRALRAEAEGKLTGRQIEDILTDEDSVSALTRAAGLDLASAGTTQQRRAAVESAIGRLAAAPAELGRQGQAAFQTVLDQAQRRDRAVGRSGVLAGFTAYYEAGRQGQPLESVESAYGTLLTEKERTQAHRAGADDAAEGTKATQESTGEAAEHEAEYPNELAHVGKAVLNLGRKVGFYDLPLEFRRSFRSGLNSAAPEAGALLRSLYRQTEYVVSVGTGSWYNQQETPGTITLGRRAVPSTLAHELFHRADAGYKISSRLGAGLIQDYVALQVTSDMDIKGYLIQKYPEAFEYSPTYQIKVLKEEYRGIADILNGLADGKINYGYGHKEAYWKEPWKLEAEAWAQFGRIQYENDGEVLKMFSELFPNLLKDAMIALKELI